MSSIIASFKDHAQNPGNLLLESQCSSLLNISLTEKDFSLKGTSGAYENLVKQFFKLIESNDFSYNDINFFDIQPHFINEEPISGIMGLHLSLYYYLQDSSFEKKSCPIFDFPEEILKISNSISSTCYSVASWIQIESKLLQNEEDQDEFSFFKISANMHHTKLPTQVLDKKEYTDKLLAYLTQFKPLISLENILEYCHNEYLKIASAHLNDFPELVSSASYVFLVIFCREFAIPLTAFLNIKKKYSVKFISNHQNDLLSYIFLAFNYINDLWEKINPYSDNIAKPGHKLLLKGIQKEFKSTLDHEFEEFGFSDTVIAEHGEHKERQTQHQSQDVLGGLLERPIIETPRIDEYFSLHQSALKQDDCIRYSFNYIKELFLCCNNKKKLTAHEFNKTKFQYELGLKEFLDSSNILKLSNRNNQKRLIEHSVFQHVQSYNLWDTISYSFFENLELPELTLSEQKEKYLLHNDKQPYYDKHRANTLKVQLVDKLNQVFQTLFNVENNRLSLLKANFSESLLKTYFMTFYIESYIRLYISINHSYDFVLQQIENDINSFSCSERILYCISVIEEIYHLMSEKIDPSRLLSLDLDESL